MKEYQLFLRLLAEKVFTAKGLRDASDFHAWLLRLSDLAAQVSTVEEFFAQLD